MFNQQLTTDGGAEDLAPRHERMRLFDAPKTIPGQLAMPEPEPEPLEAPPAEPEPPARPARLTTREKRERKAERLRGWAENREAKQPALNDAARADEERTGIPFGQPILVGHHSERRHRRAIERIDRAMSAAVENGRKAEAMRSRAETIEAQNRQAIYSDDVDAVERLREKIARLEAERDEIKRINAAARKGTLTDAERLTLARANQHAPIPGKHGGFPAYHLTNLSGNIARLRKRLEQLEAPERGRLLTVRYAGECRVCGETIDRGERAVYFKRSRELQHETCS